MTFFLWPIEAYTDYVRNVVDAVMGKSPRRIRTPHDLVYRLGDLVDEAKKLAKSANQRVAALEDFKDVAAKDLEYEMAYAELFARLATALEYAECIADDACLDTALDLAGVVTEGEKAA